MRAETSRGPWRVRFGAATAYASAAAAAAAVYSLFMDWPAFFLTWSVGNAQPDRRGLEQPVSDSTRDRRRPVEFPDADHLRAADPRGACRANAPAVGLRRTQEPDPHPPDSRSRREGGEPRVQSAARATDHVRSILHLVRPFAIQLTPRLHRAPFPRSAGRGYSDSIAACGSPSSGRSSGCRIRVRAQAFQRSTESSLPAGRLPAACSNSRSAALSQS